MKNTILLALLGLVSLCAPAQDIPSPDRNNDARISPNEWQNYDAGYNGVKGTPLLFEEWRKGRAELTNGSVIEDVFLNYDLIKNVLLLKKSREEAALTLMLEKIEKAVVEEEEGQWREWVSIPATAFEEEPEEKYLYGILIPENRQFIKRGIKRFVKADYKRPFSTGENFDEFVPSYQYYLKNERGQYEKVKLKYKAILKVIGGHRDDKAVRKYIRDNELWARNEASAIQLIEFLMQE